MDSTGGSGRSPAMRPGSSALDTQQPDGAVGLLQPAGVVRHPAPTDSAPARERELQAAVEPVAGVDVPAPARLARRDTL